MKKARLFGKINGTERDYYVAEVRFEEGKKPKLGTEEEAEAEEAEGKATDTLAPEGEGEGPHVDSTNYFAYYVSNSADGPWVQLPDVTHAMIVASRKLKKFFTGRLDTPVITNPPFPTSDKPAKNDRRVHRATEKDVLRAQIARIAHTTTLCRQKYFKLAGEEEEEAEDKAEGGEVVIEDVNELLPPVDPREVQFLHMHADILKQGGCRFIGPPEAEEGEEEQAEEGEEGEEAAAKPKKKIIREQNRPKLASIHEDTKVLGKDAWSVRLCNENIPEAAVAVARSNLWDGAVTVATQYKLVNFYSGYGLKADSR